MYLLSDVHIHISTNSNVYVYVFNHKVGLSTECSSCENLKMTFFQNMILHKAAFMKEPAWGLPTCQHAAHCRQMCQPSTPANEDKFNWKNYSHFETSPTILTPNLSPLARKFTTAPLTFAACTLFVGETMFCWPKFCTDFQHLCLFPDQKYQDFKPVRV